MSAVNSNSICLVPFTYFGFFVLMTVFHVIGETNSVYHYSVFSAASTSSMSGAITMVTLETSDSPWQHTTSQWIHAHTQYHAHLANIKMCLEELIRSENS